MVDTGGDRGGTEEKYGRGIPGESTGMSGQVRGSRWLGIKERAADG